MDIGVLLFFHGKQRGRIFMREGKVVFDPPKEQRGFPRIIYRNRLFTPADGAEYIKHIPYEFRGGQGTVCWGPYPTEDLDTWQQTVESEDFALDAGRRAVEAQILLR